MPPLVRGSQVCIVFAIFKKKTALALKQIPFLCRLCVVAHCSDPAADRDATAAAAPALGVWSSSSPAGRAHLCTQCAGAGPEDHSAGPDPGRQRRRHKRPGLTGHCHSLAVDLQLLYIYYSNISRCSKNNYYAKCL